jgi:putative effector of murein hydrolase LrgA (UPF0299 family)
LNDCAYANSLAQILGVRPLLNYITLIFLCQLVGELVVQFAGLPLPGPVIGMVLLFLYLAVNRRLAKSDANLDASGIPVELAKVGDALLSHLSLLFVPAGVGIMVHFSLLKNDWLPLSAAIIGSTLLTVAVTAGLMVLLSKPNKVDFLSSGKENSDE